MALIVTQEVDIELKYTAIALTLNAEVLAEVVEVLDTHQVELLLGKDYARVKLRATIYEYMVVVVVALTNNNGDTLLYDARLL